MKKPLVSIIIPVYNVEQYLDKCLISVCNQTYSNLQIILVDDGSTDGSSGICDLYAAKDQRIIVIHQENAGQSVARNTALNLATGDYIAFVDGDDEISTCFIEQMYNRSIIDCADIVVCEYNVIDEKREEIRQNFICQDGIITKEDYWKLEFKGPYMFFVALWNKLFKKHIWEELRFEEGKYAEDSFAVTKYVQKADVISIIKKPLYQYLIRKNSAVHYFDKKNLDSIEARFDRIKYYYSIRNFQLMKGCLSKTVNTFSKAIENLDFNDALILGRYNELREEYKRLYLQSFDGVDFSKIFLKCTIFYYSDDFFVYYFRVTQRMRKCYKITKKSICAKSNKK